MNRRHFIASLFRAAATAAALAYAPGVLAALPVCFWQTKVTIDADTVRRVEAFKRQYRQTYRLNADLLNRLHAGLKQRLLDGDWQA